MAAPRRSGSARARDRDEHRRRRARRVAAGDRRTQLRPGRAAICSSEPGSCRPLSVRNTFNDLLWIAGLIAYLLISGVAHRRDRPQPRPGRREPAARPPDRDLPRLERPCPERETDRVENSRPVRDRRERGARRLLRRAAVYVPHLFSSYATSLRGHRRGVRDDLGAVRLHGGPGRLGGRRTRGVRRAGAGFAPASDRLTTRSGASGTTFISEAAPRWQTLRDQVDRIRESSSRERSRRDGSTAGGRAQPSPEIPRPISTIPKRPTIAATPASLLACIQREKRLTATDGAVGVDRVARDRHLDQDELDQREDDHQHRRDDQPRSRLSRGVRERRDRTGRGRPAARRPAQATTIEPSLSACSARARVLAAAAEPGRGRRSLRAAGRSAIEELASAASRHQDRDQHRDDAEREIGRRTEPLGTSCRRCSRGNGRPTRIRMLLPTLTSRLAR